jgi:sodium/bile acid cotransporter 7
MKKESGLGKLISLAERFGIDYFILGLLSMIFLAWLWPEGGAGNGRFSLSELAGNAVSLIFFFYGLRLSRQKLVAGLENWRLHVVVQLSTFVLFPLLVLSLKPFTENAAIQYLWLGSFFLATLPSTVSSSVVMVSIAEGNIPAAIFNASISGVFGIFLTPLWMSLVMNSKSGEMDAISVIGKLFLQVLLPVVIGIILNPALGAFAEKYRKELKYFDQSVILVIVYTSFSESFSQNIFSGLSVIEIVLLGITMMILFFITFSLIILVCRFLKFNRRDKITAVFCGSKKSLIHGTVMSKVLFNGSNILGLLLLPLMFYHALQLVVSSIIARKIAKNILPGQNAVPQKST